MQFDGCSFYYDPVNYRFYPQGFALEENWQIVPTRRILIREILYSFYPIMPANDEVEAEVMSMEKVHSLPPGPYAMMYRPTPNSDMPYFASGQMKGYSKGKILIKQDYWEHVIDPKSIDCLFRILLSSNE